MTFFVRQDRQIYINILKVILYVTKNAGIFSEFYRIIAKPMKCCLPEASDCAVARGKSRTGYS